MVGDDSVSDPRVNMTEQRLIDSLLRNLPLGRKRIRYECRGPAGRRGREPDDVSPLGCWITPVPSHERPVTAPVGGARATG